MHADGALSPLLTQCFLFAIKFLVINIIPSLKMKIKVWRLSHLPRTEPKIYSASSDPKSLFSKYCVCSLAFKNGVKMSLQIVRDGGCLVDL